MPDTDMPDTPDTAVPDTAVPDIDAVPRQVPVTTADGAQLIGRVMQGDIVIVEKAGLVQPISITLDGLSIEAELVHESTSLALGADEPWTALELPVGTFDGGCASPTTPPSQDPSEDIKTLGARVAFWCLLFPGLRGCR